jgi:HK97 family phage major capsid protein
MELTQKVKDWLIANGVSESASDEEFLAAITEKLAAGDLPPQQLAELTTPEGEPGDDPEKVIAGIVGKALDGFGTELTKKFDAIDKKFEDLAKKPEPQDTVAGGGEKKVETTTATDTVEDSKQAPSSVFGVGKDTNVTVRKAHEQYSTTKGACVYPDKHKHFPGQRVKIGEIPLDEPSQLDLAVIGSFFKWSVRNTAGNGPIPRGLRMTEHDEELLEYAKRNMAWTGIIGGDGIEAPGATKVDRRFLTEMEQKAILDDAVSGGLEAAPIVFDDAVIITPLLHGELFPLVDVVNVARGRRIEGFSIGNPTITSGTAEGTSISMFDTSGYIAAFDTTIYNAVGAMEIGLDFEEDSPVNIGNIVKQRYGQATLAWLDNQLANGDGTTELEGVFNATGITDIGNPAGGAGATPQITDFETLLFSLAKEYRDPSTASRQVFISNDTSYSRMRGIPVGAADARRVFGMDHESYRCLDHPYKVQNDIANNVAGFFNLAYYRCYKRLGMTLRVETAGQTLALKNLMCIILRMRWGGQLELGGAGAYSDNWQA